jgi:OOP family OmpA-OmpF porin
MIQLRRAAAPLVATCLLAALGIVTLSCAKPTPCPTNPVTPGLAVAVGAHANSARPVWPAQLDGEIAAVVRATEAHAAGQGVTLVRVDGGPTIACVMTFNASAKNPVARKRNVEQFAAALQHAVTELTAAALEANPLDALGVAAAAAGPGGTVVLIDSGLQTVAPLDFRKPGLLGADIDSVVRALARARALPDLHGRKVVLAGIGYTAPPQPPLDENRRAHLIELWQKIVTAAGAGPVVPVMSPNTTPAVDRLPKVGIVPVPPPGGLDLGCDTESIFTDDGPVGFRPNGTDFTDATAARAVLARFVRWLAANSAGRSIVTGSIAHYGADGGNSGLSQARADRVRSLMIDLGADPRRVAAAGAGWGPFPSKSASPDPLSDQRNRRVVITLTCQ